MSLFTGEHMVGGEGQEGGAWASFSPPTMDQEGRGPQPNSSSLAHFSGGQASSQQRVH